jgi:hypothetical protein
VSANDVGFNNVSAVFESAGNNSVRNNTAVNLAARSRSSTRSDMNRPHAALPVLIVLTLLAGGCGLKDVRRSKPAGCRVPHRGYGGERRWREVRPLVVVLAGRARRRRRAAVGDRGPLRARERGTLDFRRQAGEYRLAAFEDRNRDLVYQPGEPMVRMPPGKTVACATGGA